MTPRDGNVTEILRPGKRGRWQSEQVSQRGCDLMKCRGGFSALQFKVDMSPVAAGGRGFAHALCKDTRNKLKLKHGSRAVISGVISETGVLRRGVTVRVNSLQVRSQDWKIIAGR